MATNIPTAKKAARDFKNRVYFPGSIHPEDGSSYRLATLKRYRETALATVEAASRALKTLLPIEEGSRHSLEGKMKLHRRALSALEPRKHRYPIFSTEPLTWRDEKGYPKLVLMALNQKGVVKIEVENSYYSKSKGFRYLPLDDDPYYKDVSLEIHTSYADVGRKLMAACPPDTKLSISMELGNFLIPPSTHLEIARARTFFRNQLFLIVEAEEWVENEVTLPNPDPLVVGYEDGFLFLIDTFDLTSLEALASEFTRPQLPAG